jgi:deoxyribodipyrimidine photo-lyase
MKSIVNIVWFKRDLRINDHAPLFEAVKSGNTLALYIVEPAYWALPDSSRRQWQFIHDSLLQLDRDLKSLQSKLIIRTGEAVAVFEDLRHSLSKYNIVLWSHEETGNGWTFERDKSVIDWCNTHNIVWNETPSAGVVRRLKSRDGWAGIRDARMNAQQIAVPPSFSYQDSFTATFVDSHDLPDKDSGLFGAMPVVKIQPGGRDQGLRVLNTFLASRARNYMSSVSKPAPSVRYCSRLSPHLAFGTLSVREVEQSVKNRIRTLTDLSTEKPLHANALFITKNLRSFLSRLAWHCHFIQKLEQQPDIEFKCVHEAFEGMREPHFREDFFNAWKTGTTGYPLVDACMRSVYQTGWLTFRMRAMVVSFASYDLWLDWPKTAHYLAQVFTDYEPGIHYPQFQMQSGVTGINAVRMYNPVKQSMDHDPTGAFIRSYVPELVNMPEEHIHEPWRAPHFAPDYPPPLVDHVTAIKKARAEITARRKSESFKSNAASVHKKLGSRRRSGTRKKKVKKVASNQLSFDFMGS